MKRSIEIHAPENGSGYSVKITAGVQTGQQLTYDEVNKVINELSDAFVRDLACLPYGKWYAHELVHKGALHG